MAELNCVVQRIKDDGMMSYRKASAQYGVPCSSTLHNHVTGKVSSSKRRSPTVLTEAEEQELCDWALYMAESAMDEHENSYVLRLRRCWTMMDVRTLSQTTVQVRYGVCVSV